MAEGLVDVPGDDVHALQRIADVLDGVAGTQGLRVEAREDEQHVEGRGDEGAAGPVHGREHYDPGPRPSTRTRPAPARGLHSARMPTTAAAEEWSARADGGPALRGWSMRPAGPPRAAILV